MPDQPDDAVSIERPVFEGAWNAATVAEREAHNKRVREWKQAQGIALRQRTGAESGEAQTRTVASSGQPAGNAPTPDATTAVLVSIRDDANAHDSDRIRAAQALIGMEREAAGVALGPSPLVALRQVLETLPPEERLAWLQGERVDAMEGRSA